MKGGNMLKNFQKVVDESLGFLEVQWVRILILILIVLYIVGGIPLLTADVAAVFHNPLVKIGFILLILYVGFKDIPLALLLALAFVLSLQIGYRYQLGAQLTASPTGLSAGAQAGVDGAQASIKAALGEVDDVEGLVGGQDDESPEGYNMSEFSDCVKDCAEGEVGKGDLSSPCRGVGVWKEELNAQGLNCPLGYSGVKDGAPF